MCGGAVERLLKGLTPFVLPRLADPEGKGIVRVIISTPLPESEVAGYLSELAARVEPKGVKVGSYPRWGKKRNTVTLVGRYVSVRVFEEGCILTGCAGTRSIWTASRPRWFTMFRAGWSRWKGRMTSLRRRRKLRPSNKGVMDLARGYLHNAYGVRREATRQLTLKKPISGVGRC
jgi:hypothetical protein